MRVAGVAALLCLSLVALSSSATPTNVPGSTPMAQVPRVHIGTPADGSSDEVAASELPKVHLGIKHGHALHFDAPPSAHVGTPASRAFISADSKSHRKRLCSNKRSMSKKRGFAAASTPDEERLAAAAAGGPQPYAKQNGMQRRSVVLSEKDQQYRQKLQRIEWAKQQAQHPPETYDEDGEHPLP